MREIGASKEDIAEAEKIDRGQRFEFKTEKGKKPKKDTVYLKKRKSNTIKKKTF